jgi:hypothetical protein
MNTKTTTTNTTTVLTYDVLSPSNHVFWRNLSLELATSWAKDLGKGYRVVSHSGLKFNEVDTQR